MTQRICHHLVAAYPNFNILKFLAEGLSWIYYPKIIKSYQKCVRGLSIIMKKYIKKYSYHFQNAMW